MVRDVSSSSMSAMVEQQTEKSNGYVFMRTVSQVCHRAFSGQITSIEKLSFLSHFYVSDD